jgi:hypothetical protein
MPVLAPLHLLYFELAAPSLIFVSCKSCITASSVRLRLADSSAVYRASFDDSKRHFLTQLLLAQRAGGEVKWRAHAHCIFMLCPFHFVVFLFTYASDALKSRRQTFGV